MGDTFPGNMPWKTTCSKAQRWRFVTEARQHKVSISELSRRWAISRKTAYKWLHRYDARGRWGLGDQSHLAHRVHNRPSPKWLGRIRRWRRLHPSWGAPKLHHRLRRRFGPRGLPSEAAIGRWLRQWQLTRKRRRSTPCGPLLARAGLTIARWPNEVWTVDFKGWYRTGDGTRVEPLTVRDLASRYLLAVVLLPRQNVAESRQAFEKIFRDYGLPRVIRADNGAPFGATGALGLTRLSVWWVRLGIRVEFIQPGHPEQNGAHEQVHRVYAEENLPAAYTWKAQQVRTERWRQEYNRERPHEALGMRTPRELYRRSRRRLPRKLQPWRYPSSWETRLVRNKGMISFRGRSRFVGEAFETERVGLKRSRAGVWEVHLGKHLVGELWDRETGGIHAVRYQRGGRR